MASNIVQCVLAVLVILHPSAFLFTCSAHLPNPMDNPTDDQVQEDSNNNSSGEESNIILLNNINKKIWDANSLAPGLFCSIIIINVKDHPPSETVTLDGQSSTYLQSPSNQHMGTIILSLLSATVCLLQFFFNPM